MSPHDYGPNRPEDHPQTVTVLAPGKWPATIQVPTPEAIERQRAKINGQAWHDAQVRRREADL